jgi:hypothetical protein
MMMMMKENTLEFASPAERAWQHAQATVAKRALVSTSIKYAPKASDLQDTRSRARFPTPVTIEVRSADMMDTAWQLAAQQAPRERVLLHNMCHATQRGGFPWTTGAMEEALFRASDISGRLPTSVYPIRLYEAVVTTDVERLSSQDNDVRVDVISAAALNLSDRVPGKRMSDRDAFVMRAKIECLLWVAWTLGYTCLILSAWGCGGFGCPPEHVAELFRDALWGEKGQESPWRYAFRQVVFCIQDSDGQAGHSNHQVFRTCFEGASSSLGAVREIDTITSSAVATTHTRTSSLNAVTIDALSKATSHSEQLAYPST